MTVDDILLDFLILNDKIRTLVLQLEKMILITDRIDDACPSFSNRLFNCSSMNWND